MVRLLPMRGYRRSRSKGCLAFVAFGRYLAAISLFLLSLFVVESREAVSQDRQVEPMFISPPGETATAGGERILTLNPAVFAKGRGGTFRLELPDGQAHRVIGKSILVHDDGIRSWFGRLANSGPGYDMVVTQGPKGIFGRIVTPTGVYLIEPRGGGARLWSPAETDDEHQQPAPRVRP